MIDSIEVLPVTSPYVEWWWPFVGKYVESALPYNYGEATVDDIREACKEREMQLWVIRKGKKSVGAATTMLVKYARKTIVRVVTLGGDEFDTWAKDAVDVLNAWTKEAGADGAEACVRKGFEKKLKDLGFNSQYVVMIHGKPIGIADAKD